MRPADGLHERLQERRPRRSEPGGGTGGSQQLDAGRHEHRAGGDPQEHLRAGRDVQHPGAEVARQGAHERVRERLAREVQTHARATSPRTARAGRLHREHAAHPRAMGGVGDPEEEAGQQGVGGDHVAGFPLPGAGTNGR